MDARHRNMGAHAIDHQGENQEHDTTLEIAVSGPGFAHCLCCSHRRPSIQASEPPAASIAARAPAVAEIPLRATLLVSSPDLMTLAQRTTERTTPPCLRTGTS